jgi:hypothetical protein
LRRLVRDLQTATASHEALFASFRKGLAGELVALGPVATGKRLLDVHSLRSSTKLVVILLLLLLEEGLLGFPGTSQVAFYATFFASTGNLGRQNKTYLVGLAGLLGGFAYGVVTGFLTSRMPGRGRASGREDFRHRPGDQRAQPGPLKARSSPTRRARAVDFHPTW